MTHSDTICAIATPPGTGAIAVIRVSGELAREICDPLFIPHKKGASILEQKPNTIHYGTFRNKDEVIDEVLVSFFQAPHSYTGEDVLEISCHGSVFIQQKLLQAIMKGGARMAEPGEFTMRAFLNGKMDLSQAEGVADLIASSSEASHKMALQQMRGGFSHEIKKLREKLLHFISLIELELDFGEEDVEFADRGQLNELLQEILEVVNKLTGSFEAGNVLKNGVPVAIIGDPNVGKSTLLNALLREDRAIVSEIAGTTRDVIEDVINLQGIAFRFIDTAGLRHTTDKIETLGIAKTNEKIQQASVILYLTDATASFEELDQAFASLKENPHTEGKKILFLLNKADQLDKYEHYEKRNKGNYASLSGDDHLYLVSAKNHEGVDHIIDELVSIYHLNQYSEQDILVSNLRHYQALEKAGEALERAREGLKNGLPEDLLAQDIREALHYLGEITGEISTDEVLGNIFKNFCIGK